jgi:hypothetical protein
MARERECPKCGQPVFHQEEDPDTAKSATQSAAPTTHKM